MEVKAAVKIGVKLGFKTGLKQGVKMGVGVATGFNCEEEFQHLQGVLDGRGRHHYLDCQHGHRGGSVSGSLYQGIQVEHDPLQVAHHI